MANFGKPKEEREMGNLGEEITILWTIIVGDGEDIMGCVGVFNDEDTAEDYADDLLIKWHHEGRDDFTADVYPINNVNGDR